MLPWRLLTYHPGTLWSSPVTAPITEIYGWPLLKWVSGSWLQGTYAGYCGHSPVASFAKEVNPRLAKRPLRTNGRLANRGLTSLVKEATGHQGDMCHWSVCLKWNRLTRWLLNFDFIISLFPRLNTTYRYKTHLKYNIIICNDIISDYILYRIFKIKAKRQIHHYTTIPPRSDTPPCW